MSAETNRADDLRDKTDCFLQDVRRVCITLFVAAVVAYCINVWFLAAPVVEYVMGLSVGVAAGSLAMWIAANEIRAAIKKYDAHEIEI